MAMHQGRRSRRLIIKPVYWEASNYLKHNICMYIMYHCKIISEIWRYTVLSNSVKRLVTLHFSPYPDCFKNVVWTSPDTEKYGTLHGHFIVLDSAVYLRISHIFTQWYLKHEYTKLVILCTCLPVTTIITGQFLNSLNVLQLMERPWFTLV